MLLRRTSHQGNVSLEAWFTRIAGGNPPYDETGRMMLTLLQYLQSIPPDSIMWAHTSMYELVLDDADDYLTNFGRIGAWDGIYQMTMRWMSPVPPSYDDFLWAKAKALVVGQTTELPMVGQMIVAMIEHAPRTSFFRTFFQSIWATELSAIPPRSILSDTPNPLRVVTARSAESLPAFYHDLSHHAVEYLAKSGQRMLHLIEHLEATGIPTDVWAYRDDEALVFVPGDAIMPGITVKPGGDEYMISYPWSSSLPGWENASVACRTDDSTKAAELIQAAKAHLRRSQ